MGNYTVVADADYRNESWTLGGGVVSLTAAWNNDDDAKYASCPGNRGRAAVRFPVDISSANIPDGAVITSVTIMIRVRKTVSDSKSVTVNVLSTENTSRYTSRTLYPTTSFANYEVGTYTTDPVGKAWDKARLNKLAVQVFSYSVPPNDGVRVAKLYAVINYKSRPTVTVTAPTGTVTSPSPTISWTYAQTDGDLQKSAEYKVFTAARVATTAFNPDTATATYSGTVSGDLTSFKLPTALTPDSYYLYVRVTSAFGSKSAWNSRAFTLSGAAPGVPGGGLDGGIGTGGGGGFESVIADSATSNAYLTLRDGSNLLSVQQASFETSTDSLGYTSTNCTLSYDTAEFYQGTGSMKMSSTASGDMRATSSFIEVAPSTALTARAQVIAAASARTVNLNILFYDESFTLLGGSTATASAVDSTSTYTEIVTNGTSPAAVDTTVYAQVQIEVKSTGGAAEVHNVDQIGLMYGVSSQWSHGGHMSRNILSSAASDADDPITVEPWSAGNTASTVSRVTSSGTGAEGSKMFRMTYNGTSPSISYVSTGTTDSQTSSGTGFTLNKPASVADGDLLVAYVAADTGVVTAANAPSGWSLVNSISSGGTASTLSVLMRDGLAADPSTWVGNLSSSGTRRRAVVVAYRGAAATSAQLLTQSLAAATTGSAVPSTPVLSNAVSTAWRLSAFALRDDTSTAGSMTANISPPSTPPAISYVGKGANWWYGGAQSTYQVNKPSNLQANDLMLAFGSFSGTATPTAPSGWTQVRRTVKTTGNGDDHSGSVTLVVWRKIATGSEPSSWTASYTGTGTPLMTQCVAYRNVDTTTPILTENAGSAFSNDVDTPTVNNTDSKAWRVCAFTFTTNYGELTSSNEATERADNRTDVGGHPDIQIGVYDSNGTVSTGNHTRWGSVTSGNSAWCAIGWIGLLKPTAAVAPGANESERADGGTASSSNALHLGVYDSGASAATGSQRVYGNYTPSSGTTVNSTCAWIGFLLPATPVTAGEVGANLASLVDISDVAQAVLDRSGGKVTFQSAFLGTTGGAPYLKLYFYNGNELIATRIAEGQAFNTSTWVKSVATFDIPSGTTRIGCGVAASDREVGDHVYWDRASVAFGDATVWRRGTGRTEHPIFNVPVIEYAEDRGDGYGGWATLGGSEKALLKYDQLTGLVTFVDQMLTPLAKRKYRARTLSYGLEGDVFASGFGQESQEISLVAQEWWIKDPTDPDAALQIIVKSGPVGVTTASTAAVFQALGANRPVVLTEGYKGDTFTIEVRCDRLQYAALKRTLNSRKTLFLQTNLDAAWWVRPIGDIGADYLETWDRHEDPLRWVKLTFTEVDPE